MTDAHFARSPENKFLEVNFRSGRRELLCRGDLASGAIIAAVVEGTNAVAAARQIMGSTRPTEAAPGTIRADFADSIDANAVHGSDGPDTARQEVAFFFAGMNVYSR